MGELSELGVDAPEESVIYVGVLLDLRRIDNVLYTNQDLCPVQPRVASDSLVRTSETLLILIHVTYQSVRHFAYLFSGSELSA